MQSEKAPTALSHSERLRESLWKRIYPLFPPLQNALLKMHLIWHKKERQRFPIGWLRSGATLQELEDHLSKNWGFGNHFVAWKDTDQVLSWRRLENFEEQWHLRVYADGELRGHYERTPEANPIEHFREVGELDRLDDFKKFLGEYCADQPSPMTLTPDPLAASSVSEITVETSPQLSRDAG